jgi:hypothetical protein
MGDLNIPQPGSAYCWIYLDGKLLNDPAIDKTPSDPDHPRPGGCILKSFSYTRKNNSLSRFELTIIDPTWYAVENAFKIANKVEFEYGWETSSGGRTSLSSSRITMMVSYFRPQLRHDYVQLSIRGHSIEPIWAPPGASQKERNSYYKHVIQQVYNRLSPEDAKNAEKSIKKLLEGTGVEFEPPKNSPQDFVKVGSSRDSSKAATAYKLVTGKSILRFIIDEVIPNTVNKDGVKLDPTFRISKFDENKTASLKIPSGGYRYTMIDSDPPRLVFKPWWEDYDGVVEEFKWPRGHGGKEKIISFEPNIKDRLLRGAMGGASIATSLTLDTNEATSALVYKDETATEAGGTPQGGSVTRTPPLGGLAAAKISEVKAKNLVEAIQKLGPLFTMATSEMYTARLVVVGTASYRVFDWIKISVIQPDNNLHTSSGLYMIDEIIDTISNGFYTTTLSLRRIGSNADAADLGALRERLKTLNSQLKLDEKTAKKYGAADVVK